MTHPSFAERRPRRYTRLLFSLCLALVAFSLVGCTSLMNRKRTIYRYEPEYGVESPEFRQSLNALGSRPLTGNRVELLQNGDEFFPAMLEAIGKAQHSINMEMYIFTDDRIGSAFGNAMVQKAMQGVEVRLLVDDIGSRLGWIQDALEMAGGQAEIYQPLRIYSIHKVGDRTHRKLLVVDGEVAFVGGLGIDERWKGDVRNSKEWRETVVLVEGPVVSDVQTIFMEDWLHTTGEVLHGPRQFPEIKRAGTMNAQAIRSSRRDASSISKLLFYMAIQSARRRIWIQNAYFVPDRQIRRALVAAAKRGVEIKVMVPGRHIDLFYIRLASRFTFDDLLEAGVEIYEYQPAMLHNKVMMVDDVWSTIGSINFVNRSMRSNAEANIAVYDREFAKRVKKVFLDDLEHCQAVGKKRFEDRGPLVRSAELFFWLFSDNF